MLKRYVEDYCEFCKQETIQAIMTMGVECTKCGRFRFTLIKSARGFSLVEVIITAAIVVLLSAIAIPSAARARRNAEDARTTKELRSVYAAIVTFQANNNFRLPVSWDDLDDYISISNVEQKYELNAQRN